MNVSFPFFMRGGGGLFLFFNLLFHLQFYTIVFGDGFGSESDV